MRQEIRLRVLIPIAVVALLGLGVGAMAFTGTPVEEPLPSAPPKAASDGKKKEKKPSAKKVAKEAAKAARKAERLAGREWRKQANQICAGLNESVAALGEPQRPEDVVALLPETVALAESALDRLRTLQPAKADARKVKLMLGEFASFARLEKNASAALANQDVERFVRLNARAFKHNDRGSAIARRLGAKACAAGSSTDSALERELAKHRVVVAVLYTPDATLDGLLVREARAGAAEVRAGFVAIAPTDSRSAALLAKRYGVRAAPAVLVFVRWRGAVATFTDYVDRETIAQAAELARL
jgi:hypothetical protein